MIRETTSNRWKAHGKCKSFIQQANDQHVKDVKSLRDTWCFYRLEILL